MYFVQIFKYDKPGEVVWEGPVADIEVAETKLDELELITNRALDMEYWLITPKELADWAKGVKAQIVDYTGEFPDLPQGRLRRMK